MDFFDLLHHATLEAQLQEIFSEEVFERLELPKESRPKIYQGLPRHSLPHYPKYLFVKDGFADLSVLKKRCADKAILSLYRNITPFPSAQIVLFTYVIPGGLGDYFAQQKVKEALQEQFPSFSIHSIALMHSSSPHQKLQHDTSHTTLFFSSIEEYPPEAFPSSVLDRLRCADIILQIPTLYPWWSELLDALHQKPTAHPCPTTATIGEYGFICSPVFYPATNTRCLGLHFLEHGLLLPSHPCRHTLSQLKDTSLLALILQGRSLEEYERSTLLYFGYLCTKQGYLLYLQTILTLNAAHKSPIDLCVVDIGPLLTILEESRALFVESHIKEIAIFYKGLCSTLSIREEGKKLRVIHTGPLDHEDFHIFLLASREPVGIRGNLSLSEAIAYNKTYIYDPLDHNTTLYHGLMAIAKTCSPEAVQLLESFYDSRALSQTAIQEALQGLSKLNSLLHQEHNAIPYLIDLIVQLLLHRKHPALKQQESLLLKAFCTGEMSLCVLISKLRDLLKPYQQNMSRQNPN